MLLSRKKNKILLFSLIILMIGLIIEFIIPSNRYFPKPSNIFAAFPDVLNNYHVLYNSFFTLSVISISLVSVYFLIYFINKLNINEHKLSLNVFLITEEIVEYITPIIIGLLLIYWFPKSEIIEFIFGIVSVFSMISIAYFTILKSFNRKYYYILSTYTLVIKNKPQLLWKASNKKLLDEFIKVHVFLWSLVLAYEFIKDSNGIGAVFHTALKYNDIPAFFSIIALTSLFIFIGNVLIKFLKDR